MTVSAADPLFRSAPAMAHATNYASWTFEQFAPFVHGDVLEVGCGVGTYTRRLVESPRLRSLLSVDVSADAVEHCGARVSHPALTLRQADVTVVQGAFDLIVCMNVLEHIEDDAGALAHMLELLGPGGTLFLLVPAHDLLYSDFDRESGHYRRYNKHRMKHLLSRACAGGRLSVRQFYFNSIGAIGYFVVYRLLRKAARADASAEIGSFDRYVVPALRRIEGGRAPFGISLVTVVTKPEVG